jgi:hypothetical protein
MLDNKDELWLEDGGQGIKIIGGKGLSFRISRKIRSCVHQ